MSDCERSIEHVQARKAAHVCVVSGERKARAQTVDGRIRCGCHSDRQARCKLEANKREAGRADTVIDEHCMDPKNGLSVCILSVPSQAFECDRGPSWLCAEYDAALRSQITAVLHELCMIL